MTLRVPEINPDMDVLAAALAYAEAGWYVIPVRHDTKAPTVVGKRWQDKSSRDVEQLAAWFAGTDHALGLHVGRSGAVVFDVDEPSKMPEVLWDAISAEEPPFQSTRTDVDHRGHYVFAVPPGRMLGNSRGKILHPEHGAKWGEVRGANGIIVVEPSRHVKEGGRYSWLSDGEVPVLPDSLASLLPDATDSADSVSDETVRAFLAEHTRNDRPSTRKVVLERFAADLESGSRHEALTRALPWAMREARAGLYAARGAYDEIRALFLSAMASGGPEPGRARPEHEFASIAAWAIGQALAVDAEAQRERIDVRLDTGGIDDSYDVPAPGAAPVARDSDDYLYRDAQTNKWDLDVELLALDVIAMGPLAVGIDHRFWSYADGVWREDQHVVQRRVYELLRRKYRPAYWVVVQQILTHRPEVERLYGDPTEDYINFTNGMLHWRTGDLLPHDPSYKSTIQLPVAWNPDAECPQFDKWLHSILSDDYVDLAWQMIGYLMMSGNPLQVAFLFLGKGGNGKGTLIRVLKALLGSDNYSAASLDDLTGNRFAAASLYGKTANLAGDIDSTFQESTARFKMLTGEDTFQAENKGQPGFRFTNWAVPVFSANKLFGSSDTSEGYLRRWVIMKFERSFSAGERIIHLDQRFYAELPGIAARGVEALRKLMTAGRFHAGPDVEAGKAEFIAHLDQVHRFVDEWCETDDGSEERSAIYKSYRLWADANGVGRLSAQEFYSRLENIPGISAAKINGVRRFRGIRVKVLPVKGDIFSEG